MRWPEHSSLLSSDRIPCYLIGFGAGLAFVVLCEAALLFAVDPRLIDTAFLIGAVSTLPFLAGIVYAGYWLRSSPLSASRYPRIVGWWLGGLVSFLLFNLVLIVTVPPESWFFAVAWVRWAIALGAGIGLLIGCIEGRAIERALTAERDALRAEHLEEQRDYLDYLNGILRHEVLNTATIIDGYATRVLEEESTLDERSREWLEIVIEQSEEMSTVIDDVRVLLKTTDEAHRTEPINATRVLTAEIDAVENRWDGVEVEAAIPERVFVRADDLLGRVFANLLANAVEHNDAETPRIEVAVDPGPETVRFDIADNGPGIPDAERDSLFDRVKSHGSTHGLGLYLVDQLVTRYDGHIELSETGPDGSRFTVELPAAESERNDESIENAAIVAPE